MRLPLDHVDPRLFTRRRLKVDTVLATVLMPHGDLNRLARVVQVVELDESARFLLVGSERSKQHG